MKIFIGADMEGITGVVDRTHVDSSHGEYGRFCKLMTADMNAAVEGAFAGGADEVVITDGHGSKTNILVEELDKRALLNTGSPTALSMVTGIDAGADGAFFVGYHARVGTTQAILSHTISGGKVAGIWLNGRPAGEIGLNASVCGYFNVPLLMVSSDAAGCAEGLEWVPGIETSITKKAHGRYAAECLLPAATHDLIRSAAERAVKRLREGKAPASLKTSTPVEIVLALVNVAMADTAALLPGAERVDANRIKIVADDLLVAYKKLRSAILLARG
jgi:D-amino peptidase